MEKEEVNITTVSIPKILAEKLKKKYEGTGFNSLSSYVTYILREVLSNLEKKEKNQNKKAEFSEEEEEKVKERLKSLGYLN